MPFIFRGDHAPSTNETIYAYMVSVADGRVATEYKFGAIVYADGDRIATFDIEIVDRSADNKVLKEKARSWIVHEIEVLAEAG